MAAEDQGCCAHLVVNWRTKSVDSMTTGWWECSSGCETKFWPVRPANEIEVENSKLRRKLEHAQIRWNFYQEQCDAIADALRRLPHRIDCAIVLLDGKCDCGKEAALADIPAASTEVKSGGSA